MQLLSDVDVAYLASEDVEVVCRGSAVDQLPIDALCGRPQVTPREPLALINGGCIVGVLISHLQEPLYPTAAVLRTLQEQVIQLRVFTRPILLGGKGSVGYVAALCERHLCPTTAVL